MRVERFDTVVIGGGQAGLAVGQQLAARDADFVILSDEKRVGDNWRRRWDSLRLFTPAKFSGLPGMPFPAPSSHLADKDEVADYLERYAERFDLPVCLQSRVTALRRNAHRFVIDVGNSDVAIEADNVIVATGPFQQPSVPRIAGQLSPDIVQLHSSEYRNPFELPEGPVLVAGAGNSGAQIALELARFREVWLAGRPTGHLPRRALGRDLFDWIWPIMNRGTVDTRLGRRMRDRALRGGDALIGIPEREIVDAGIRRVGRIDQVRDGLPVADGQALDPGVIVWCTGFRPDYSWIGLPILGPDGYPRHQRGVATDCPGLYFVGLRFQHRQSSSLIGGVAADAEYIANAVGSAAESFVTV